MMPIEEESILREILGRTIAVETELRIFKSEIHDLKSANKEFSEKITKLTLDYHQAKGAIQLANWIALAIIALTAGLGSIWLSSSSSRSGDVSPPYYRQNEQKK